MKSRILTAVLFAGLTVTSSLAGKTNPQPTKSSVFYVYSDKGARVNHFAPSGWMGDYGDLKLNDASTDRPEDGRTAVKWSYTAKGAQGANWAGAFWQDPPNNWGDKPGGYDLTGYKRLTFWARGEKGGEKIAEFKTGGITGEYGDSDSATLPAIELTQDWKKYTIDLSDKNLAHWIGGFCWSASRDDNPNGFDFYLDDIRFER